MVKKRLFTASLAATMLFSAFSGAAFAEGTVTPPPAIATTTEAVAQVQQASFEEQYKLFTLAEFFQENKGFEVTAVNPNQFILKVSIDAIVESYKNDENLYTEGKEEFLAKEKEFRAASGTHIEIRISKQGNGSKKEIKYLKQWQPLSAEDEAGFLDVLGRGLQLERDGGYFYDTLNHWAEGYIQFLYELGVVNGQSPTKFNPNGQITRAQLAVMIFRAAGLTQADFESYAPYNDVKKHWAGKEISVLYDYGLIDIYDSNNFNPEKPATREEVAAVMYALMLAYDYEPGNIGETAFKDKKAIDPLALEGITVLQQAGIIGGYKDGTFKPKANVTRAQFAKMLTMAILASPEE